MKRNEQGFTLVEVLVALTVLAIGLVAVAAMIPHGTTEMRKAKKVSSASFAAQQTLEQIRVLSASAAGLTNGMHPSTGYSTFADEPTLLTRYSVADMSGTMAGVKMVTVTVRWQEGRGDSLQVVSYVRPQ